MHSQWSTRSLLQVRMLYAAYGWLLVTGVLHFGIDVVSPYIRGSRVLGPETKLYYGLNTAYALSQILFALMGLMANQNGAADLSRWPGLTLGFTAASAWLAICFLFLQFPHSLASRSPSLLYSSLVLPALADFPVLSRRPNKFVLTRSVYEAEQ